MNRQTAMTPSAYRSSAIYPILADYFKRTEVEQSKQELLIFVTPKILKEDLTVSAR